MQTFTAPIRQTKTKQMENIPVTTYRGFSTVGGETTLAQDMADIKNGTHAKSIIKIAALVAQGKTEEANNVKKQLPFRTVTANYRERRLAYGIIRYNPVITLDIDDLDESRLSSIRSAINDDPDTLGSFLSPKRHGYKLFVFRQTEYAHRLRRELLQGEIGYERLEEIHLKLYNDAKQHYEALLGTGIDGSGKDISRGYFMSFDPEAYLNTALQQQIKPLAARIIAPEKGAKKKTASSLAGNGMPASTATAPDAEHSLLPDAEPWEKLLFSKAVTAVKRNMKFQEGNRNNFLFALGNKCYAKGLGEEPAVRLAQKDFGKGGFDVRTPLHNAYTYTDKTSEAAAGKENRQPVISRVMDFLQEHYGIRRNTILDRLEFAACNKSPAPLQDYRPMRGKDYNSIFVDLQLAGIPCFQNFLKAVIDSDYAKEFNPFTDYLDRLSPWDGTDYIGMLADTVQTDDQPLWAEGFRKWIVGMVACALREDEMNQLVIILYSEQGRGKSSWIRRLLPPEWKEYFYNGIIDPANKDHKRLLATRIIINMEEFEGVRPGELAALKRIIAQDNITQRKAYDVEAFTLARHSSFIGSTNNRQCLQDIGGNRRFLPVTVRTIDYRTPVNHPGIYAQVLALLDSGFRYWYEGEEIDLLNRHNELHRMKDPVEENLFVFYRKPLLEDTTVKWLPASAILTKLSIFGKVQVNRNTQQILVQVLEKYKFNTRRNEQNTVEYEVTDIVL